MGLSLMNMLDLSSSVHSTLIACYWNFLLSHYTQVLCQYGLCRADQAYVTHMSRTPLGSPYIASAFTKQNTPTPAVTLSLRMYNMAVTWCGCSGNVFTEPLPSDGRLLWFCYSGFQQICHSIINAFVYFQDSRGVVPVFSNTAIANAISRNSASVSSVLKRRGWLLGSASASFCSATFDAPNYMILVW
jgi:hypothetical protein